MSNVAESSPNLFIYIAALRRTGSTVLSESLTSFPETFVFREPKLGRGRFTVKASDIELFNSVDIDIAAFAQRSQGRSIGERLLSQNRTMTRFKEELLPQLLTRVQNIGVKEIHHDGWQFYSEAFPAMKVLLTARDPRDIYISTHHRVQAGKDRFRRGFSPASLARDLNRDFQHQLSLAERHEHLKMRYEDICTDESCLLKAKAFAGCEFEGLGQVGQFNAANPNRADEAKLHGDKITESRIERWKQESDEDLKRAACSIMDLMPEYAEYWGYER